MSTRLNCTAFGLVLLAASPLACAAESAVMEVTLSIENSCGITAQPLSFGRSQDLSRNLDAESSVSVACSSRGPIQIAFDMGAGNGATVDARKLSFGAETVSYSLFLDSSRSTVLGDGSIGNIISATSSGGIDVFPIYGRVFGGQGVKPVGAYADVVTATLTF